MVSSPSALVPLTLPSPPWGRGSVGGLGEEASGEEDIALARGEHAARLEGGPRSLVSHRDLPASVERVAEIVEAQQVVALDRLVVGGVVELERYQPPVDEVGAVDAREALGEDHAHAQMKRPEHRRLAGGALTVDLAAHEHPRPRGTGAGDEVGIRVPEGELRDGGHVGAED